MIRYSVEWYFSRRVVVKIKYNRFVQVGNIEIVGFSIGSSEVKETLLLFFIVTTGSNISFDNKLYRDSEEILSHSEKRKYL